MIEGERRKGERENRKNGKREKKTERKRKNFFSDKTFFLTSSNASLERTPVATTPSLAATAASRSGQDQNSASATSKALSSATLFLFFEFCFFWGGGWERG